MDKGGYCQTGEMGEVIAMMVKITIMTYIYTKVTKPLKHLEGGT